MLGFCIICLTFQTAYCIIGNMLEPFLPGGFCYTVKIDMPYEPIEATKYWLALSSIKSVGARTIQLLVERFGSPEAVFLAPVTEIASLPRLNFALAYEIAQVGSNLARFEKLIKQISKSGIDVICPDSLEYPYLLKKKKFIKDPPAILYKKGVMPVNNEMTIAIVGTRFPSENNIRIAERIAEELAKRNIVVVSGLAKGIDTSAHTGALRAKGKTIAVIGSGLKMIYPKENRQLADKIYINGAVLSECHPNETVSKGKLIQRNRIISGISLGVILVEPERGALNTAYWASKQNRNVFIYDQENKGKALTMPENYLTIADIDEIDMVLDKMKAFENNSSEIDSSEQAFLFKY